MARLLPVEHSLWPSTLYTVSSTAWSIECLLYSRRNTAASKQSGDGSDPAAIDDDERVIVDKAGTLAVQLVQWRHGVESDGHVALEHGPAHEVLALGGDAAKRLLPVHVQAAS